MLVRYCTAVALKRHERVNAFNLVVAVVVVVVVVMVVVVVVVVVVVAVVVILDEKSLFSK